MCLYDGSVRQRQLNSGGGASGGRLTDNAESLMLEFARSKQEHLRLFSRSVWTMHLTVGEV